MAKDKIIVREDPELKDANLGKLDFETVVIILLFVMEVTVFALIS